MSPRKRSDLPNEGGSKGKSKRNGKPLEKSRKEIRKEQRMLKKVAKAAYFQKRSVKDADQLHTKIEETNLDSNPRKNTQKAERKRKKKARQSEQNREKQRKLRLHEENVKEDKLIKQLEKRLKLNKRKQKAIPKSFVDDGLDYILDLCSDESRKRVAETERSLMEDVHDPAFENDLSLITRGNLESDLEENPLSPTDFNDVSLVKFSADKECLEDNDPQDSESDQCSHEEVPSDMTNSKNENQLLGDESLANQSCWEDIYGRERDQMGNVVRNTNRYIPPAARSVLDRENVGDENLLALRKRLKGCINRLAEQNMHSIANQIEELYMTSSRNHTNNVLSESMLEALVSPILTPDRLVAEHVMLIAILHANIGMEVGAHFLLVCVGKCNAMLRQQQQIENKELDNLILIICHLYNFKIFGPRLLYQILDKLTGKLTEKEIELILLILKTVGFALRKADPAALKNFIQILQQKASACTQIDNSRVKFMVDVLLAIKNNNVSKIPQYDPSHVEHLKKVIKSAIRKGNTITPINVSLEDLLNADERGKWWVIGSAWAGPSDGPERIKSTENNEIRFGEKILELARKQRMNTDARRNIFCVLMTAEDYLDAFEKLHHLGLREQQEREVVHVLMHCCFQERKFNPYYAVLAQKLCEYDRKYRLTTQYAFWDKLKALDDYSPRQLNNLARFLTHLFLEKSLSFSVMKVVQFADLDKQTMRLVRQIMLGILLHENEDACLQVFEKICISPQLQTFRESLRLFINHFLIKNMEAASALGDKEAELKKRSELLDKMLASRGSRVVF